MGVIQIKYREGFCEQDYGRELPYSEQCHTVVAEDAGCKCFNDGSYTREDGIRVLGCGACIYAKFKTIYKGLSVKRYTMEEYENDYNPWLNCMIVYTSGKEYECEEVILDGVKIYGE